MHTAAQVWVSIRLLPLPSAVYGCIFELEDIPHVLLPYLTLYNDPANIPETFFIYVFVCYRDLCDQATCHCSIAKYGKR